MGHKNCHCKLTIEGNGHVLKSGINALVYKRFKCCKARHRDLKETIHPFFKIRNAGSAQGGITVLDQLSLVE